MRRLNLAYVRDLFCTKQSEYSKKPWPLRPRLWDCLLYTSRRHRSLKIKQYCKERTDPEDYRRGVEGNGYEPEGVSSVRKYEPRNRRKGNSKEANEERVKSLEFGLRKSLHARRRACIKDLTKSLILAQDERWRRA